LKPISSGLSPIYFDLRNRERLCVFVGHRGYFMRQARSFIFVWQHSSQSAAILKSPFGW
jgi:hypothetical protein